MRASRSWPRSSVPSGWLQDGFCSLAPKSISLIGTCQRSGPSSTASAMKMRITAPATARRWRRKRRHASAQGEWLRLRLTGAGPPLTVRDAGVEPAIKDVGEQVAEDHQDREHERDRHDHRRVVGEDRADEERADARHAEDLFGDDGAAE